MFNKQDAIYAAKALGIKFDKFTLDEFLDGINIEVEHGMVNPQTNVTNSNLIQTSKIALAHLNEFPNYYNRQYGLKVFENYLKKRLNEEKSN